MQLFIGCSGWNYRNWKGLFYPDNLAQKNWLQYYAGIFNSVEVNNTFYRLPRASTLQNWKKTVPGSFCFTLKGSQFITHMKKLNDCAESLNKFEDIAVNLEHKLGCVLWQLPPSLHRDDERLINFCKILNRHHENVIEFRHKSWFCDEVYDILRTHNVVFCSLSSPVFPEELITTTQTAYIRFHGKGKKWYDYSYSKTELNEWKERILACDAEKMYIYFNNDIGAEAPKNARQLAQLLNHDPSEQLQMFGE